MIKKKASYTGNSTASYYRKYGPSGVYTKAAKDSLPITQYFTKQHIQKESESNENLNEKLNEKLSKESNDKLSKESDNESSRVSNDELSKESDIELEDKINDDKFSEKMETLEVILHQSKKKISVYDYLRYRSVYEFFVN